MASYATSATAKNTNTTPAVTLIHTAGDVICSVFIVHAASAPSSVTFDGAETGVVLAHSEITQSGFRIYIYTKFGVAAGSHAWSSTISNGNWIAECVQINNANRVKSVAQYNSASSTGWSLTVNPLLVGEILVGGDTWEYGHGSYAITAGTSINNATQNTAIGAGAAYIAGDNTSKSLSFASAGATPVCAAGIVLAEFSGGQVIFFS
jgi:hypothetical protein